MSNFAKITEAYNDTNGCYYFSIHLTCRCDIWLHESLGEFVSEFGFANDSIPISVATFSRESKPDIIAISNVYEDNSHTFNPFQKTQGHPDVGECLDSTPLLLRIVLDGKFTS